ncbi:ABC transporter substrate-binding protein [Loktanella sp. M215]|uniref:ABC transporter substrate-binding protein n=1 Tax=Loktanella sp. M215 TaxID=2675431 RepID=UPI001F234201|nr:ABC transporter substrate-binding protein [Loktanella sp. M215]MCF7698691.1 ABC transporter substrate-binding protein [Loktanella sp. M215]
MISRRETLAGLMATVALPHLARAEAPLLNPLVGVGQLPAEALRLPQVPRVLDLPAMGRRTGQQGGTLRILISGQRDVRLIPIYSYARLMAYSPDLVLEPDILAGVEQEGERQFTLHLRPGHRWSDGTPFTAEDFRYTFEDVISNTDLYKSGLPPELMAGDAPVQFAVIDDLTVRYTFASPVPSFLPKLAAPLPTVLFMPSAYLKQFHATYTDEATLVRLAEEQRVDDWKRLHMKMSRSIRPENPDLPTLEAWMPRTAPPAEQFVFDRNPYFHRVDQAGTQLPYVDRIELNVASSEIILAKTATGESDLQMAGLDFIDYTLLRRAEKAHPLHVALWRKSQGSAVALYPNLNCADTVWRDLFRDVRMRRALSVAIDREEINKALFFGLGTESADTVIPESPLFRPEYATAWSQHDPDLANALLDELGLTRRGAGNIRRLPDGRQAGIVVETAGESTLETDVLALVRDHFRAVGLALYIRSSQRDVFRSRALAGLVQLSVWAGLDNGVPDADTFPGELAPTTGDQLQWPLWGSYYAAGGAAGEAPDLPEAQQMLDLLATWQNSVDPADRTAIWHKMLALKADQVFSIGTVNGALQPVVRNAALVNVPDKALYGFEPTSFLGAYLPDTFFLDPEA